MQRIIALHLDGTDGVATLVIRGELPLLVLHDHRLPFGAHHHLVLRILEIGHVDLLVVAPRGEQSTFVHEIREIRSRHSRSSARERGDIHILRHRLVADVHAKNSLAPAQIRQIDYDLSIEAAGPHEGGIENIRPVRGSDQDDAFVRLEAVHLHQQLIERLFALVVTAAQTGPTVAADGVDFVDEDDARSVSLALFEQIANATGADADEHLHEVGARHREERTTGFTRDSAGKQCFARSRRTDQQRTLRQATAKLGELLRILQEFDDLLELVFRFVHAGDVLERHLFLRARRELGFALPKRQRLVAAALHLAHEEDPEADHQQNGCPRKQKRAPRVGARLAGRDDDAITAYNIATAAAPRFADPLNGVGAILVQKGHPREAIPYFDSALSFAPDFYEAELNRAVALSVADIV